MDLKHKIFKLCAIAFIGIHASTAFSFTDSSIISGTGFTNTRIPLVAITDNQGDSWHFVNPGLNNMAQINNSSCVDKTCILSTLDIIDYTITSGLRISNDNGQTWIEKQLPGIPNKVTDLRTPIAQCIKTNDNKINCIVAQSYQTTPNSLSTGIIATSKDLGNSWQPLNVINPPTDFNTADASFLTCSSDKSTCIIFGGTKSSVFMLSSQDQGNSWTYVPLKDTNMVSDAASCAGTTCIIEHSISEGKMLQSQDSGKTWREIIIPQVNEVYGMYSSKHIACTGHDKNTLCISAGFTTKESRPRVGSEPIPTLYISKDSGDTWERKAPAKAGKFTSISCVGEGNTATCVVVGNRRHLDAYGNVNQSPLIFVSNDGGNSWTPKSIPEFSNGFPFRTNCQNSNSQIICIIEGYKMEHEKMIPFIAVSNDQGNSWKQKSIEGLPQLSWGMLGEPYV